GGAARADRAVQWGGPILVADVDVCAGVQQYADRPDLPFGVPCGPDDVTVRGVMQWSAATMIGSRVGIRASRQQCPRDFLAITGCSQMKCCISGVKPAKDFGLIQLRFFDALDRESALGLEQLTHPSRSHIEHGGTNRIHRVSS